MTSINQLNTQKVKMIITDTLPVKISTYSCTLYNTLSPQHDTIHSRLTSLTFDILSVFFLCQTISDSGEAIKMLVKCIEAIRNFPEKLRLCLKKTRSYVTRAILEISLGILIKLVITTRI